ncbi:hypothetical protein [Falsiroseomonas sp. CW058]|uniref:hypothetical protein n=1 Tax=Falsiroseomonas sp. CW058 TaxID=3388664 RepID=UPI003D31988C
MATRVSFMSGFRWDASIVQGADEPEGMSVYVTESDLLVGIGEIDAGAGPGISAQAGGSAVAFGGATSASAAVTVRVDGDGAVGGAVASATMQASAMSTGGGTAFASASAFVGLGEVSGHGFFLDYDSTTFRQEPGLSIWESESAEAVYVIAGLDDITPVVAGIGDDPDGPAAIYGIDDFGPDPGDWAWTHEHDPGCGCGDDPDGPYLDGNSAWFEIDAVAYGHDTVVVVDISALVVEDALSQVSGAVHAGVG